MAFTEWLSNWEGIQNKLKYGIFGETPYVKGVRWNPALKGIRWNPIYVAIHRKQLIPSTNGSVKARP